MLMGAGGRLKVPVVTARATINQLPQRRPAVASQVVDCPTYVSVLFRVWGYTSSALSIAWKIASSGITSAAPRFFPFALLEDFF